MLLNLLSLSYETSNHTRVRIIISTNFAALESKGTPDSVSMNLTQIPVYSRSDTTFIVAIKVNVYTVFIPLLCGGQMHSLYHQTIRDVNLVC